MTYNPGDVVKCLFPRHDPRLGGKRRPALVLTSRAYNTTPDHGILAAFSAGTSRTPGPAGAYQVQGWKEAGLMKECAVVPWLYTLVWDVVLEKVGELSPYEFSLAVQRLREVVEF